jgi:hypothetical protein
MSDMTDRGQGAPLQRYLIVDVVERWAGAGDARVPAGACWHCGSAIAYCVLIEQIDTGEQHEIGTTCAERIGLDPGALKKMLAAKFANDRATRAARRRQADIEAAARAEAAATAQYGPHGTEARFHRGCMCDACQAAAPHGITHRAIGIDEYRVAARFFAGCRCLECIEAVVQLDAERGYRDGYRIVENVTVVVDVKTGVTVEAKKLNTRYGWRWCVRGGQAWLPVAPEQRQAQAKFGFVEVVAPWLVAGREAIIPLGCPIVDAWGEPLPRPQTAAGAEDDALGVGIVLEQGD